MGAQVWLARLRVPSQPNFASCRASGQGSQTISLRVKYLTAGTNAFTMPARLMNHQARYRRGLWCNAWFPMSLIERGNTDWSIAGMTLTTQLSFASRQFRRSGSAHRWKGTADDTDVRR